MISKLQEMPNVLNVIQKIYNSSVSSVLAVSSYVQLYRAMSLSNKRELPKNIQGAGCKENMAKETLLKRGRSKD